MGGYPDLSGPTTKKTLFLRVSSLITRQYNLKYIWLRIGLAECNFIVYYNKGIAEYFNNVLHTQPGVKFTEIWPIGRQNLFVNPRIKEMFPIKGEYIVLLWFRVSCKSDPCLLLWVLNICLCLKLRKLLVYFVLVPRPKLRQYIILLTLLLVIDNKTWKINIFSTMGLFTWFVVLFSSCSAFSIFKKVFK